MNVCSLANDTSFNLIHHSTGLLPQQMNYMMHGTNRTKKTRTYTAAATVEYEEFGFHATSLTGN